MFTCRASSRGIESFSRSGSCVAGFRKMCSLEALCDGRMSRIADFIPMLSIGR